MEAGKRVERAGFNCYEASFADEKGDVYSLFIMNELLFVTNGAGENIAEPPDKICIVDEESRSGVSTKELLSGKQASLLCVRADPVWKSPKGLEIFGKKRFL